MSQAIAENGHAPQTPPLPGQASSHAKQPVPESMTRFTVHVPSILNDGSTVPTEVLNALQEHAVNTFGGYTLHPDLRGGWLDENRHPFHEPIFKIEIEVADRSQAILRIIAFANFIRQRLDQDAVFVTIEDVGVLSI
jgi:hypothetical protein